MVDYRDERCLFDCDGGDAEPFCRALGRRPEDRVAAAHYDAVLAAVAEARAAVVLAQSARHVPLADTRPPAAVEALPSACRATRPSALAPPT